MDGIEEPDLEEIREMEEWLTRHGFGIVDRVQANAPHEFPPWGPAVPPGDWFVLLYHDSGTSHGFRGSTYVEALRAAFDWARDAKDRPIRAGQPRGIGHLDHAWYVAFTKEPDESWRWYVWDRDQGTLFSHGVEDTFEDAKIAAVMLLLPSEKEGR
jgi:hypothetical protein